VRVSDRSLPPFPTRRSSDLFVEEQDADHRRSHRSDSRPDGVSDGQRNLFQRYAQQCEADEKSADQQQIREPTPFFRYFFEADDPDRKSTRLNSSHVKISYAV